MTARLTLMAIAVATLACLATTEAQANPVTNGVFETGDLTGWVTNGGNAGAASRYREFTPTEGAYLGWVEAGLGVNVYTTLSQTITLSLGDTVSGVWGFQANDYSPYNDDGYLSVNGNNILVSNVSTVGDYGNSGWIAWSYVAPTSGDYTFQIGVENGMHNHYPSGVVLDAVVTSAVPEPASMAIFGAGLAGIGLFRRSKQA